MSGFERVKNAIEQLKEAAAADGLRLDVDVENLGDHKEVAIVDLESGDVVESFILYQ